MRSGRPTMCAKHGLDLLCGILSKTRILAQVIGLLEFETCDAFFAQCFRS